MARTLAGSAAYEVEYRAVWPDGSLHYIAARGQLARDANEEPLWIDGLLWDVTDRKRADERIRASLREKEVLLKEIHHRVKNNMQVISSLVALQAERLPDAAMRAVLQDVTHRVRSMALVHEKLYQSADMAQVQFAEYAQSLLNYLWRAHETTAPGIRLALDLEPVQLSVNAAVPCGLVLNELASNALKHAFHSRADGEVSVVLRGSPEGRVCLRVRDNGTGLPAGLDWRQADTLGLRLVQMLAGQLDATVDVHSNKGTEFTVTFGGPQTIEDGKA
jgi:two-component sensor histidine kinase